jgi:parallel beta-helix repeat protein
MVVHNTCVDNSEYGFYIKGSSYLTVTNNSCLDNYGGNTFLAFKEQTTSLKTNPTFRTELLLLQLGILLVIVGFFLYLRRGDRI